MTAWQVLLCLALGAAVGGAVVYLQLGAEWDRLDEARRAASVPRRHYRPPRSHCKIVRNEADGG